MLKWCVPRRPRAIRAILALALHSAEMEGGHVSDVLLHEAHDYANGLIDAATLGLRVCARYGLNDR